MVQPVDDGPQNGDASRVRPLSSSMGQAVPQEGALPEDEQQVMLRRLWKSDELIKQLKHIVKAQHGKIEELRERLEFEPLGSVRSHMAEQNMLNSTRLQEDNEELRRTVYKLKADVEKLKSENSTLRKSSNRLKRMLQQQENDDVSVHTSSIHRASADIMDTQSSLHSAPAELLEFSEQSFSSTAPTTLPSVRHIASSPRQSPNRPQTTDNVVNQGRNTQQTLPKNSKLWRLSSVVPMFWRDLDSPGSVLETLIEISGRLLGDGPSPSILIYMLDAWLRLSATDPSDGPPRLFYLGAGKTTVQVFCKDSTQDSTRAEPPRFGDLQALPTRTRATLAVPIQMPTSHTKLAVLQVVSNEELREKRTPRHTPKALVSSMGARDSPETQESQAGFTDSQLMYLQLVCNVAGGILEQLKVLEQKQRLLDHMHSCVDVSVAINQVKSLPDFEQRVKHALGNFFQVTTVRVLFYDGETHELLISSAQMKRKGVSRLRLDKGVVGLCAKRQTVVHVPNISHHPYMDAAADGLQRSGRPISADSAMLVGPLVIEQAAGTRLVGVVQLLERKKKTKDSPPDIEDSNDFTDEEQNLFQQILRVCAHVAWRTYKAQDLEAQLIGGQPAGLAQLLAG